MAKKFCTVLGFIFLLIGLLGYLSGISPHGYLFGLFMISPLHNLVHLISGLVLTFVGLSGTEYAARRTALTFGLLYGLVTLIGFISGGSVLGLFPVNMADNMLHLVISIASISVGMARERVIPLR